MVLIQCIIVLPCAAQQTETTESPFNGLVPQDLDPNTKVLRLYRLPIPVLDNTSFVRYPYLRKLYMEWCSILYVKSGAFDSTPQLKFLSFVGNRIREFPNNFGLASKSIVEIRLWYSLKVRKLPPLYFRNFTKLLILNLGDNKWKPFDPSILPASLKYINLNFVDGLSTFPNFTHWTPNLKGISIGGNLITEIPPENIRNMNITSINIRGNRLMSISDYTAYPCIEKLILDSNILSTIPDFYNTTLTRLTLSNNPLVCGSVLCWIRMWPWMFDTPLLTDTPTCASPAGVAGTPLMEVRPIHLECYNGKLIVCWAVNSSPPGPNGRHFADNSFRCISMNAKFCALIGLDNGMRLKGDKPLSEPMLTRFTDAYMQHKGRWVNGVCPWFLWTDFVKGPMVIYH